MRNDNTQIYTAAGLFGCAAVYLGWKLWQGKAKGRCAQRDCSENVTDDHLYRLTISLPQWLVKYEDSLESTEFQTEEEMMKVAIDISARNVQHGGGPFGCAIFERNRDTKKTKLFATGANRVVQLNNCCLHGETVAIQFALQRKKNFSLGAKEGDKVDYVLCTSCEPCAMCMGAVFWSGVSEMVCGATKDDAERIGFDEGPVYPQSYKDLEKTGTVVKRNVLRKEAASVLEHYGKVGVIYNG